MPAILIVEDEPKMRDGLKDNLSFEGYDVDVTGDGGEGLDKLVSGKYDLALLDVMLPTMSGFDILRTARTRGVSTPVIMVTAKGEEIDRVLGLELGADDYVLKPFSLRELLARVKAVLRRRDATPLASDETIHIGALEVHLDSYVALRGGKEVPMTAREFEVLKFLWAHRNHNVSRETLLNEVWGYEATPTTRTIDNFIVRLRQKIEPDPAHPRHIVTVHGAGYRLIP
jgi:DNA-binding response OmpR family regulator